MIDFDQVHTENGKSACVNAEQLRTMAETYSRIASQMLGYAEALENGNSTELPDHLTDAAAGEADDWPRDMRTERDLDAIVDALRNHIAVKGFELKPEHRDCTRYISVRLGGAMVSTGELTEICEEYDLEIWYTSAHPTGGLFVTIRPTQWECDDA